jgi:uncharacterized membrane protein (UPF0127 family)
VTAPSHFLSPLISDPRSRFALAVRDSGSIIATQVETAFTSETRRRGLLGRTSLDAGAALIIAPCSAVHTFFMRFRIDVAFADRRGILMKFYSDLAPWRIAFAIGAFATIELPAGTLTHSDIHRRAALELRRVQLPRD